MIFVFIMVWFYSFCFFFFKQKTAYEMRISDWSSDVCSSDLVNKNNQGRHLLSCGSSFFMHAPYSTRPNPSARALRVQVAEEYQHGRTVCPPGPLFQRHLPRPRPRLSGTGP